MNRSLGRIYSIALVLVGAVVIAIAYFVSTETTSAQIKRSPSIHDEQTFPSEKVLPVITATDTFNEMISRDLVAPKPDMTQILASKGKRPRNPPAEIMEPAPQSIYKVNPKMYFDYDKVVSQLPIAPQVASPGPNLDFQGLGDANTSIPPDTHGAVGPNHIMTALNTEVRIQSKTGTTTSTVTLNSFFASVGGGSGTFDPRVIYDPYANRWICVAVDDAVAASSKVLIAVSQTTDPTGTWNFYGYDHDAANVEWADYPMVGFNKNWIAVSINDFTVAANAFSGANTYVFDKSTLYAGAASPTVTKFDLGTSVGNVHQPVDTYDNSINTLYVLQRWNGSVGQLRIYTINGTAAAPTFTATALFPATTAWNDSAVAAPQSGGGAITVTNNDSRMQRAVYRNGSVWAAHTIYLPTGTPTRTAVQWWQFNPTTAAVTQAGRVDDPTGANFYSFPSIAVNAANQALIGYSAFSATTFPSAAYSYRGVTDATTTTRDPLRYKNGLACYRKTFGGGTNRWGDYSNTVVDPVDDTTFWTLQEYAETAVGGDCTTNNTGRWGVWWAKVIPPCSSIVSSGNWNTAATWGCSAVPTASDDAVIVTGQNVTLNTNAVAASVTVNEGGTLSVSGTRTAGANVLVNGTLNLTGGVLDMGANTLRIGCTGTITGASATGRVIGAIQKDYCAASGVSFTYPVSDADGDYAPFAVSNLSGTGSLTASTVDSFLPGLGTTQTASRYWTLSGSGVTANLIFTYTNADINGNEALYRVYRRSGGINTEYSPWVINTAANTATATGVSAFSDWGVGNVAPTAASVSIEGRVLTASGSGIKGAVVTLTGSNGNIRTARTSSMGYYRFDDVQSGSVYVIGASAKRFEFTSRTVTASENISDFDIVAN